MNWTSRTSLKDLHLFSKSSLAPAFFFMDLRNDGVEGLSCEAGAA
jgi:hypothetical protein